MPESVKICAWAVQASALRGYHPLQGIYVGRAGAEKAKTKKRQQTEANNLGMLLWMVAAFAARVYKRWKCVGVTNMSTTSSRHNSLLQAISSLQIFFFLLVNQTTRKEKLFAAPLRCPKRSEMFNLEEVCVSTRCVNIVNKHNTIASKCARVRGLTTFEPRNDTTCIEDGC